MIRTFDGAGEKGIPRTDLTVFAYPDLVATPGFDSWARLLEERNMADAIEMSRQPRAWV